MNISIVIHYSTDKSKYQQGGSFPRKGRRSEQVALDFWQQIKKEMSYRAIMEKALADEVDITEQVREFEIAELKRKNNAIDDLPF